MTAEQLHDVICTEGDHAHCVRWLSRRMDNSHRAYYREKAQAITAELEPVIGSANVLIAVHVIMEELL